MKKLLVLLAAWGCICLLSTKDRIAPTQTDATATTVSDTLNVVTYRLVSAPNLAPVQQSEKSL